MGEGVTLPPWRSERPPEKGLAGVSHPDIALYGTPTRGKGVCPMRSKTNLALALLLPLLLGLALFVAACSGEETKVTARGASSTIETPATTTQAPVTTTVPSSPAPSLDADRQSKLDEFLRQLDE
jgi:hypothetical protein